MQGHRTPFQRQHFRHIFSMTSPMELSKTLALGPAVLPVGLAECLPPCPPKSLKKCSCTPLQTVKKKRGRGSGRMGMECSQTGYDSIPKSMSIATPHKHTPPAHLVFLKEKEGGDEKDQRMMSNHSELAPRGAYRLVLDHNAIVWFRSPGIGVLVRIVMQGFLLVVLVQLLLCNTRVLRHKNPL